MKPWEFDRLQPHEIYDLWDGYLWRKKRREEEYAYFTSWFVNTMVKPSVTVKDILAPLREDPAEKKQAEVARLMETFKGVLEGGG